MTSATIERAGSARPYRMRTLLAAAVSVALSACAFSPGMQMSAPPPAADGQPAGHANTGGSVPFRITTIDASLIRQLDAQAAQQQHLPSDRLAAAPGAYRLGPGDVLQITVWDHPELAAAQGAAQQNAPRAADPVAGFVVDSHGNLAFPFAGSVPVAGLTADAAQARIAAALSRVYRNPQVTLRVASFRSQQVYIDGEVRTPGAQPVNDVPMTLYEALGRAGGLGTAADQSRMTLVRDGVSYPLDLTRMLRDGRNPADVVLAAGDLLHVPARSDYGVYVMGEVNKPSLAVPLRDGRLTLSDALSQAGSVNANTADAAQMFVIRGSQTSDPQVFHLDARSPVSMVLANEFALQPKDIVYVDGNGLVRFSRVLSLLLPGVSTSAAAALAVK
ncbi:MULTISPECIES: polysaccharide biosynthesis/export family protein [Burkholderia]|uniref:polysaccharide biosynthesis/export family protein n=1 Tax=Burkholderia TaxID=32008 RepID=UPI0006793397|nr:MULTISPECIES: polysaccharide biosynthesis/export family protein [Burkholderia]KWU20385.1 sugar ABC transporter substrate-binding protein [Burkholderia cenocepacia]OXI70213.1 sugar ABC transporter substrate-binding protein [Burkholderia sp. AU31280]QRR16874.1 sugar ABC transporter substrate-binding protein [Burkholderia sp. MS389]RQU27056.1 sugar ABC transporter substrate-binding protein [Burkholderia cenocepacia]RQV85123.1 sugar ABC transporter substrate-binding protein [Burkholderia cenoce